MKNMEKKFEVGDIVYVKSAPKIKMTVSRVSEYYVDTHWFSGTLLNSGSFDAAELILDARS